MKLEQEIRQEKFQNEYHKVHVNILYTASWLNLQTTKLLKSYNISPQQFNILRILRGVHPEPASVKILTERMIDKMSNASRLVEKLKQKGLVVCEASEDDRRRVNVSITPEGLELLEKASHDIEKSIKSNLSNLSASEAVQLNKLLDQIRG